MTARELKAVWEDLGRVDPLWAVLSVPEYRHGGWDLDDFMATGQDSVSWLTELARAGGVSLGDRVLDFGCGVGRMSNALAAQGFQVVGVDIAASMVERAESLNAHPDRLSFVAYDGDELPFPDDSFDSAVSLIVLQHCGPREQVGAIMQLQRVVRPGGSLAFQLPSRPVAVPPLDVPARCADIVWLSDLAELPAGGSGAVVVRVTNRGDRVWPADCRVKLANHWYRHGWARRRGDRRHGDARNAGRTGHRVAHALWSRGGRGGAGPAGRTGLGELRVPRANRFLTGQKYPRYRPRD